MSGIFDQLASLPPGSHINADGLAAALGICKKSVETFKDGDKCETRSILMAKGMSAYDLGILCGHIEQVADGMISDTATALTRQGGGVDFQEGLRKGRVNAPFSEQSASLFKPASSNQNTSNSNLSLETIKDAMRRLGAG